MPILVSTWTDSTTGAQAYFVIDSLRNGVCAGGIRMRDGATVEEARKLARTMTYKLAAAGIPFGGAKAAIDYDPTRKDSYDVLRRFLEIHRPFVRDFWVTNEDMGTKEEDIVTILRELGIPSPGYAAVSRAQDSQKVLDDLAKAVEVRVEGFRMADVVTGYGITQAALEAMDFLGTNPANSRVAIQGFGSVGGSAARYLAREGCVVVAIADVEGTLYCPEGLDVEDLLIKRNRWGVISRADLTSRYESLPREEWLAVDADVLIPAAVAEAITVGNCDSIKARLVVEGANVPVTSEAERQLFERGVLLVPDFVANAGAVGFSCSIMLGRIGPDGEEGLAYLSKQIRATTRRALELAQRERITPRQAAIRLVEGLT